MLPRTAQTESLKDMNFPTMPWMVYQVEVIADGFDYVEGPVWVDDKKVRFRFRECSEESNNEWVGEN